MSHGQLLSMWTIILAQIQVAKCIWIGVLKDNFDLLARLRFGVKVKNWGETDIEILFVVANSSTFAREFTAYVFQELTFRRNQNSTITSLDDGFFGRINLKRAFKSSCQHDWPEVQMTQKSTYTTERGIDIILQSTHANVYVLCTRWGDKWQYNIDNFAFYVRSFVNRIANLWNSAHSACRELSTVTVLTE